MESFHAVDHLTKKPDGTTVVHYYFPNDAGEVNGLCRSDMLLHPDCKPYNDDRARQLARAAMRDIVTESGAKIEFQEVFSLERADISFVKSPKIIEEEGHHIEGYAGRGGDRNYVVDLDTAAYTQLVERELSKASPEQKKILDRALREKYGENADLLKIIVSEGKKIVLAHEVEHILGAKHPNTPGGVIATKNSNSDDFNQSIMGSPHVPIGQILGQLDIEWYERHFGVKDLPEGTLQAPLPIHTDKSGGSHDR